MILKHLIAHLVWILSSLFGASQRTIHIDRTMSEKMYFKWIGVIYQLLLNKFARFRVYVHTICFDLAALKKSK